MMVPFKIWGPTVDNMMNSVQVTHVLRDAAPNQRRMLMMFVQLTTTAALVHAGSFLGAQVRIQRKFAANRVNL
jgi:hypothetical protein